MAVQQQTYTVEEFIEIAQRSENLNQRLELLDGEILSMSPSSSLNTVVAAEFARLLGNFNAENKLGFVTVPDGGYRLGSRTILVPDVAYISKQRTTELNDSVFQVAPDLVVEVISPSESMRDVLDKARAFLEAGTVVVLAVYPKKRVVDVIRLTAESHLDIHTLTEDNAFEAQDVLPGFTLPVKDIFPEAA